MNKIQHYEIPTDNEERGAKFYREVFGWEVKKVDGDMDYWMVHSSTTGENGRGNEINAISGGMMKRKNESGPIVVVSVEDVDQALEKIKANGGTATLEKQTMGEHGYYARFKDSEGNELGLWAPAKKE